jgi:hypothetical protein
MIDEMRHRQEGMTAPILPIDVVERILVGAIAAHENAVDAMWSEYGLHWEPRLVILLTASAGRFDGPEVAPLIGSSSRPRETINRYNHEQRRPQSPDRHRYAAQS